MKEYKQGIYRMIVFNNLSYHIFKKKKSIYRSCIDFISYALDANLLNRKIEEYEKERKEIRENKLVHYHVNPYFYSGHDSLFTKEVINIVNKVYLNSNRSDQIFLDFKKLQRYLFLKNIFLYRCVSNPDLVGYIDFQRVLFYEKRYCDIYTCTNSYAYKKLLNKFGKACTIGKIAKKAGCSDEFVRLLAENFKVKKLEDPKVSSDIEDIKSVYRKSDKSCSSCMTGENAQEYLEQYKFYKVSIAYYEVGESIKARALLWDLPDGNKYLDRIYSCSDDHRVSLIRWANNNKYLNKADGDYEKLEKFTISPIKKIDTTQYMWPYMDTFRNQNSNGDLRSHYESEFNNSLDSTSGGPYRNTYECSNCGERHDPENGGLYISDEYYCCSDCAHEDGYSHCDHCGEWECTDDGISTDDVWYCGARCASKNGFVECHDCVKWSTEENLVRDSDGEKQNVCNYCFDYYSVCDDCGEYFKNLNEIGKDNRVCDGCLDDYNKCEHCDTYLLKGDKCDCEEPIINENNQIQLNIEVDKCVNS